MGGFMSKVHLGDLDLGDDIVWTDRFKVSTVAQTSYRTLGGNQIFFSQGLIGGRSITLQAFQDTGWLTEDQVLSLSLMASSPGEVYPLVIGDESFDVRFRHEEPPALEMEPLVDGFQPSNYFKGTIKLITV
jgi:hypothetical protein